MLALRIEALRNYQLALQRIARTQGPTDEGLRLDAYLAEHRMRALTAASWWDRPLDSCCVYSFFFCTCFVLFILGFKR
jgi:hypothetical protein